MESSTEKAYMSDLMAKREKESGTRERESSSLRNLQTTSNSPETALFWFCRLEKDEMTLYLNDSKPQFSSFIYVQCFRYVFTGSI